MENLLTAMITSALNMACFFIGAKIGQKVDKGEEIEVPTINPMENYRKYQESKAEKEEQRRMTILMENIENYNGTGMGQKDIV